MSAIVKPTAYISWIPKGKISVKPTEAYISWLPMGTIEVTPKICAAWLPMGTLSVKPGLCASIIPGSQKAKADTSRRVNKPTIVAGDTQRKIGVSVTETADAVLANPRERVG